MTKQTIADFLKQLRKTSGLSANEVITKLKNYDIDISAKTLYGYESGLSMPNADAFVALCQIYKCDNPMKIFGTPSISSIEFHFLEKYRFLDTYGKELVSLILEKEYERSTAESSQPVAVPVRLISYYYKNASAGTGQVIFDYPPDTNIEIPDIQEYKNVSYAIGVNGSSMEPLYHDGDILLIEATREMQIGDIGIFQVNEECFVKKLGESELISLNPDFPNIPLNESAIAMGKVIDTYTLK